MNPGGHRLGTVLCIASAVAFGALAVFGKLAYDAGVGVLTLLAALVTTGAALTFGIAGTGTGSLDAGFENEGWIWLAAIAFVSTVAPIVLFFAGLKRVGPSMAAILSTLEPPQPAFSPPAA